MARFQKKSAPKASDQVQDALLDEPVEQPYTAIMPGGLETVVAAEPQSEPEAASHEDEPPMEDEVPIMIDANLNRDPQATVAAALIAIGKLYNDAGDVSAALSKHLSSHAGEPALFAFLQRMQIAIGEFRHVLLQIDNGMGDELRNAIQDAVS